MRNILNKKVLNTLEYHKIIAMLTDLADSPLGKQMCKELVPSTDFDEIISNQTMTSDALSRIYARGSVSFREVKDIKPSLMRLSVGSSLGIGELLDISGLLAVAKRAVSYAQKESEDEETKTDSLDDLFRILAPLTSLSKEINRCILGPEEIADDASANLKHIRRSIKNANDAIHSQLTSMINSSGTKTYLQDSLITMRDGRYCIPVKAEHRSQVPGMVHDQSSTGATIFIEPMAVVKLNNTLRELAVKEQEEIEVILSGLSNLAAEHTEELESNLHTLATLDFIFAKAKLAKKLNASRPEFNKEHYIHIKAGRHPLLDPKKVVPIDIRLGKEFDLLVVTGPNTGGKTVSLKTVGLLTLMGQAGLHIPAFEGSSLSVFDEVFADIGDEQSIEQNLSTFSSHMVNVVNILNQVTTDSLVLFDELGSGTDPVEGAALAMSILSFLHNMQVRTMATTHYSELKVFALSTEGVQNACCEFDVESLRPTYRLLIGIPGKSNAFAISSKLGLPDYIIADAKKRIHDNDIAFEDIISELETNKVAVLKEREQLHLLQAKVKRMEQQANEKEQQLAEKKEAILRKAREQASDILRDAKNFADQTIKDMNRLSKSGNNKELEHARQKAGKKLNDNNSKLSLKSKPSTARKQFKASDFKVGDRVKVHSLGLEGTVSTLPNAKGDLFVQMGILRSQVHISDLEIIDEPEITAPNLTRTRSGKMKISKSSQVSPEINLLGLTSDEAIARLDKYLDDAYLSSLSQVRVVHGKGTGALRKAVHNYLKRQKHVKSFRLGEYGEGDAGVTIVDFK